MVIEEKSFENEKQGSSKTAQLALKNFWLQRLTKAGRFLVASLLLTARPIVTCGSRVSPAPPHHTLPAFLNLRDILF